MKLRAIRLENVRRFVDPVEISGIGDGLNVLTAHNERGKSTFFDALHAAFFKGRTSWDAEIRSLVPHAGGDPSVTVEIELPEGVYRIEKRWKRRNGDARILSGDQLFKQADDAEAWIAETLQSPKDGGPAGLLWVRQGHSGLDGGHDQQRARRDLLTSVAGEVELMTGGRRMESALGMCRTELERYLTPTRRVRTGGPLNLQQEAVESLRGSRSELEKKSNDLRAELERRKELRRDLAELEDPEEEEVRANRLAKAEAAHAEASRHHEALERAIEMERAQRVESERASERLEALDRNLAERREAQTVFDAARDESAATMEGKGGAESKLARLLHEHESARTKAESAAKTLQLAIRAEGAASVEERRGDLNDRLGRAEGLRRQAEQASADATTEIVADVLSELERLDETLRVLKRTRETEATAITMEYVAGRQDGISLDGARLADRERTPIPDGALLEIEDLGRLTIHPGLQADRESVEKAGARMSSALAEADHESLETARASAQRRLAAEQRAREAAATLNGIAPDGIEALREQIAGLPEPLEEEVNMPTVDEAQEAESTARRVLDEASRKLESARLELRIADEKAARAAEGVENAESRLARAKAALANIDDPQTERDNLNRAVNELRTAHEDAVRSRDEMALKAPDLETAQARLKRARDTVARANEEREQIRVDLSGLNAAIDVHAGDAVEEELADVTVRFEAAERRLEELEFEIAVLQKLESALDGARACARDRYVEPVLNELKPLLGLLWPEAELRLDAERVLPTALERGGTSEDFNVLSGGTQEQIAILVRLAFARMLARGGSPAPIILDDGIVFTDDDRIERMFDALTRQSEDLQIIVFSCRQRAFRDLGGRGLEIRATG